MKNALFAVLILALIGGGVGAYFYKKHRDKKKQQAPRFKVALVTPGTGNDGGWSQNAINALDRIHKELGAVTFKTAKGDEDVHVSFRKYAEENKCNVIIGHASEFNDEKTREIAAANPRTIFLISASERTENNVVGVRFRLEDGAYVLGQLAALMSKTDKLACIGPEPLPVIKSTFDVFALGAKSIKPNIVVTVKWAEKGSDIGRAKEETKNLIQDGTDFIFQNANAAGLGVFEAVQENKDKGVFALGSNDDQAITLPKFDDVILASAALDIGNTYVNICRKIKDGTFEKKTQVEDMATGTVTIAFNKKLEAKIPAGVRKKLDETIEKLKKGEKLYESMELK